MTRLRAEPINAYEAAAMVLSAGLVLAACGCAQPPADPAAAPDAILATSVSRATYGDGWPFTVASGILSCHPGQAVVFETSDGTVYALNGVATADPQYHDLEPIWLPAATITLAIASFDVSTSYYRAGRRALVTMYCGFSRDLNSFAA